VQRTDPPDPTSLAVHTPEWWDAVYRRYASVAYRAVLAEFGRLNQLRDARDVEDVVHEVFLELQESKGIDNNTANMAAVIYGRARQRAIDRVRRGRRVGDAEFPDSGACEGGYDEVDDADEAERVGAHAWDNLHRLSEKERKVWGLAARHVPQKEIAAEVGLSEGRISQMLKEIPKKLLEGYPGTTR
jgi:RNA polymerase sigma factor (sigma-70 family)